MRKSVIQDGSWDERRIELEIVFLIGSEMQCVNVIFDLLILQGFLTAFDRVGFCIADEIRSQLNRVA